MVRCSRWLLAFAASLVLSVGLPKTSLSAEDAPVEAGTGFIPISLQGVANVQLDQDIGGYDGNNLVSLPGGEQTLPEVTFDIGPKYVMLAGKRAPDLPDEVTGIGVGKKLSRLHFLQGSSWGSPGVADGTEIGAYIVHYDDGSDARIPIVYGESVRDWWGWDNDPTVRADVAWRGSNEAAANFRGRKVGIRLFSFEWTNPAPEKGIDRLDFVSNNETICSPFLVAVSGAPLGLSISEAVQKLRDFGAKLEFNSSEGVVAVWLAGPGPIDGVTRGSDEAAVLLSALPTLERAYLNYPGITDVGVAALKSSSSLKWLSLNFSNVTDAGLAHLAGL
jgi:hypothetical protein